MYKLVTKYHIRVRCKFNTALDHDIDLYMPDLPSPLITYNDLLLMCDIKSATINFTGGITHDISRTTELELISG